MANQISVGNVTPSFQYYNEAVNDAEKYGIPTNIFLSLINTEDAKLDPNAVSSTGAIGFTQLLPGTASDLGVNPYDPVQNLQGGAQYLAQQYKTFGNWQSALEAYNEGPNALKSGTIPNSVSQYANTIMTNAGDTVQPKTQISGIPTDSIKNFLSKYSGLSLFAPGTDANVKAKATSWFQDFFGLDFGDTGIVLFGAVLVLAAMIFMSRKETINVVTKAAKAAVI